MTPDSARDDDMPSRGCLVWLGIAALGLFAMPLLLLGLGSLLGPAAFAPFCTGNLLIDGVGFVVLCYMPVFAWAIVQLVLRHHRRSRPPHAEPRTAPAEAGTPNEPHLPASGQGGPRNRTA